MRDLGRVKRTLLDRDLMTITRMLTQPNARVRLLRIVVSLEGNPRIDPAPINPNVHALIKAKFEEFMQGNVVRHPGNTRPLVKRRRALSNFGIISKKRAARHASVQMFAAFAGRRNLGAPLKILVAPVRPLDGRTVADHAAGSINHSIEIMP